MATTSTRFSRPSAAPPRRRNKDRPSVVIANTIKGKGVKYMEDVAAWHGSVKLTREQAEDALQSLGAKGAEIKELLDVG